MEQGDGLKIDLSDQRGQNRLIPLVPAIVQLVLLIVRGHQNGMQVFLFNLALSLLKESL